MAPTMKDLGIDQPNPEHGLRLLGEIWDSLSLEDLPIPDSHREELDRRLASVDADPTTSGPCDRRRQA